MYTHTNQKITPIFILKPTNQASTNWGLIQEIVAYERERGGTHFPVPFPTWLELFLPLIPLSNGRECKRIIFSANISVVPSTFCQGWDNSNFFPAVFRLKCDECRLFDIHGCLGNSLFDPQGPTRCLQAVSCPILVQIFKFDVIIRR